ncbi:ABC transporter ATP-binding protein [Sabulicella glaciei]|uniref:ABC transporter ATP-binding protein n=1 Tax=Sabulicella glaciei TaxID=2984948 RepID=A0ABT3NYP1_9PROT|nr:ABC transporter ATP-binding protein [Roseococcus sp. MDT2-1-1]MCW8087284.1 ABC transporter ATP-binding protein [Roseococcus sp. MDT2-1-1]
MSATPWALEVEDLSITFRTDRGTLRAVEGVSFRVAPGRTLAIVGESGCGKSVTSLAVMGLLAPNARVGGTVRLAGQPLDDAGRRAARGRDMAMIFQEPMTSLNPAFTAGDQVAEAIRAHEGVSLRAATERAIALFERVRIPEAARRARQYPHQLSGGMRQRVMIAMALACRPKLLIADEPTTALDVTVQAQILALLDELKRETGTAVVLITHDLGVVRDHAEEVLVMYAGRMAEQAPAARLFDRPEHPYTIGLLGAAPRLDEKRGRLASIPGTVPDLYRPPPGCRFAPRCPFSIAACDAGQPEFRPLEEAHRAACIRAPLEAALAA